MSYVLRPKQIATCGMDYHSKCERHRFSTEFILRTDTKLSVEQRELEKAVNHHGSKAQSKQESGEVM